MIPIERIRRDLARDAERRGLGDELYAILDSYRGRKVDAATRAAIEAQVPDRCLRFTQEHGLDPALAKVFVLTSDRDPSELLVADEQMARAAIRSGRWVDPNGRFREDARMSSLSNVVKTTPFYAHDCSACVWLGCVAKEREGGGPIPGSDLGRLQLFDLYFCTQHGLPTVIARYGDQPSEYASGMALADVDPLLHEARARAVERGLVETTELKGEESYKE